MKKILLVVLVGMLLTSCVGYRGGSCCPANYKITDYYSGRIYNCGPH